MFDVDRLIKTFESCGELSAPQVQTAMACAHSVAHRQVQLLLAAGRIAPTRKNERGAQLYKLAPLRGFKAHLAREAGMSETTTKAAARAVETVDPRELATFRAELADATDGLQCALFNTGHLLIEIGDQRVRLSKAQAQALVAYLDQIATALHAGREGG